MNVDSYLNEPLSATLTIANIDADSLGDIKVSLADLKSYKSLGLSKPAYLPKLTFKITAGEGKEHIVHITSHQRIREPILEVLIQVTEKQSSILRLFTFLLDPLAIANEPVSAPQDPIPPVISSAALEPVEMVSEPVEKPLAKPLKVVAKEPLSEPEPLNTENLGTIRVGNRSISLIAQNSSLHVDDKHSVYQIMRAFYLQNTDAFTKGNISKLRTGIILTVPSVELITEVPRQKAVNFVYAASKDYPFEDRVDVVKVTAPKATSVAPVAESKSLQLNNPEPVVTEIPKALVETTESEQFSQNIQADIGNLRALAEEFKSLSSVVETQNAVIKVQSEVMKNVTEQLDARNNEYLQLDLRLDALETSGRPLEINDMNDVRNVRITLTDQNREIEQQNERINQVNEQLIQKSDDIFMLHQRMEDLEKNGSIPLPVLMPDMQLLKPPKPAEIMVLSPATEVSPNDSNLNSSRLWMFLLLAVVIIIVATREIIWRRRFYQRQNFPQATSYQIKGEPVKNEPVIDEFLNHENEMENDPVVIRVESVAQEQQEQESELNHESGLEQELELAKQLDREHELEFITEGQKQDVITNISIPEESELELDFEILDDDVVTNPSAYSGSNSDNSKLKDIYTEIDVFIAYELYSEAKKLLDTARQQHGQDYWLDIKELEILAHSKSAEIFFSLFDDQQEVLSREFPIAWKKIIAMKEKLGAEFQNAASH